MMQQYKSLPQARCKTYSAPLKHTKAQVLREIKRIPKHAVPEDLSAGTSANVDVYAYIHVICICVCTGFMHAKYMYSL